jgi:soluble lytic murein transglycosylase-like protein
MTSDILALLTSAANQYGVPPELAIAVAQQESGGNPNAVSSAGAQGVMQLMPSTAASLGVSDPLDPAQNIDGGVRYLSQLLSEFGGNTQLALAAYNWGPGNVSANGYENWPSETANYVNSIMAQIGDALTGGSSAPSVDMSGSSLSDLLSGWTPSTAELLAMAGVGALTLILLMR